MNDSNGTALAVPALSDKQIQQRLTIAKQAGYGLEEATPAQLNVVYLLCQRYRLDPLTHVTLYRGRPWVTIDGRIELAKRHPEYRGFRTRPLSKEEKTNWDYRPDDLVVECTITTASWGDISTRGKVTALERQRNTPLATNPQEMAEKRAVARACRLAFGQSAYLDEDDDEQEDDPKEQARLAQRYNEIFVDKEEQEQSSHRDTQGTDVVQRAHAAARQREQEMAEIDRQRKEEGLI